MWWNNVETKPGVGYPREWENQETQRGGWELKNGKIELKAGGRAKKLLNIFYNPDFTLHVWQPIHLSRFITMPNCALIFKPIHLVSF